MSRIAWLLYRHPYVKGIERGELHMTEAFFNETYLLELPIHEVFKLYEIDGSQVSENSKIRIYTTMMHWTVIRYN